MWDAYERKARVYPALLILFPFFVLQIFYLNKEVNGWLNFVGALRAITIISLPLVFLYFVVSLSRLISKGVFERWYFKDSLYLPTTNFLLHSTRQFSHTRKASIRARMEKDFSITLSSEEEEMADELEARRRIVEAIDQVRHKVRDGHLVLKHNIQYGFWRNLVGGSVICLLLSLPDLYVFHYVEPQGLPWTLSILMTIVYVAVLLSSKATISYLGRLYAQRLYLEYMGQQ